jgi:hypothetical protein
MSDEPKKQVTFTNDYPVGIEADTERIKQESMLRDSELWAFNLAFWGAAVPYRKAITTEDGSGTPITGEGGGLITPEK